MVEKSFFSFSVFLIIEKDIRHGISIVWMKEKKSVLIVQFSKIVLRLLSEIPSDLITFERSHSMKINRKSKFWSGQLCRHRNFHTLLVRYFTWWNIYHTEIGNSQSQSIWIDILAVIDGWYYELDKSYLIEQIMLWRWRCWHEIQNLNFRWCTTLKKRL